MERKIQRVYNTVTIIGYDSGETVQVKNTQILDRVLSIIFDKQSMLIDYEATYKDKKGWWILLMLEENNKRIIILAFYRIIDGSN